MKVESPLHSALGLDRKISVILDTKSLRHLELIRAAMGRAEEGEGRASVSRAVRAALRLWVLESQKGKKGE